MQGIEQRFTRSQFEDALRAEAARQYVRMDAATLDAFTDSIFLREDGRAINALITHTFATFASAFIDELRYVRRMSAISSISPRLRRGKLARAAAIAREAREDASVRARLAYLRFHHEISISAARDVPTSELKAMHLNRAAETRRLLALLKVGN